MTAGFWLTMHEVQRSMYWLYVHLSLLLQLQLVLQMACSVFQLSATGFVPHSFPS